MTQTDFTGSDIVLDDLDSDGDTDVMVGGLGWDDHGNQAFVVVLLGHGAGGLAPASHYPTADDSTNPIDLAIGDFDEDGNPDLVTGNFSDNMSVLFGDGQGGFQPQQLVPVGGEPFAVETADIDSDGHSDIVYSLWGPTSRVLFGDGDGGFDDPHGLETPEGQPTDVILRDLDNDGKPDVLLANTVELGVLMNRLNGRPNH